MAIDLEIFSPVQQIQNPLFAEHGVQVFIKRDDLIHPLISGNKWRKLKISFTTCRGRKEIALSNVWRRLFKPFTGNCRRFGQIWFKVHRLCTRRRG
jgi:hypothetical protein